MIVAKTRKETIIVFAFIVFDKSVPTVSKGATSKKTEINRHKHFYQGDSPETSPIEILLFSCTKNEKIIECDVTV